MTLPLYYGDAEGSYTSNKPEVTNLRDGLDSYSDLPPLEANSMVIKPKHYQIFPEYEVRDLCEVMADRMEDKYSAFYISDYVQFLQYVLRFDMKNGKEDLEKAQYYLKKMIEWHP